MAFVNLRPALLTVLGVCLLARSAVRRAGRQGRAVSVRAQSDHRQRAAGNQGQDRGRRQEPAGSIRWLFDFNYDGQPSASSNFSPCPDLSDFIRGLPSRGSDPNYPKVKTIAFVSNEVAQHTVLPVLACHDLIMSSALNDEKKPRARIGDIFRGEEQPLARKRILEAYDELARENNLGDLVKRLMDKDLVLHKARTRIGSGDVSLYVSAATLANWKREGKPFTLENVDVRAGSATFDAEQCRALGLCQSFYNSRAEIARVGPVAPQPGRELARRPHPRRLAHRGEGHHQQGQPRFARAAHSRGPSARGPTSSSCSSKFPAAILPTSLPGQMAERPERRERAADPDRRLGSARSVAGLPPRSWPSAARRSSWPSPPCWAILTICRRPRPNLRPNVFFRPADEAERWQMLKPLVANRGYPPLLFEATLDSTLVLYRVVSKSDPSDKRLMTESDFETDQNSAKPQWDRLGLVAPGGQPFKITASLAREFGVAEPGLDASSAEAVYNYLGVETSQVRVARDDWLDRVAEFFRVPLVNFLLVMLGIIGLILEMKMPGTTVPGVISALCFVLFFWSYSFVGEFTMLAILLFILGVILVGVEIFVLPGFGFTGISGVLLIIVSLGVVTLERWPRRPRSGPACWGPSARSAQSGRGRAGRDLVAWYLPSIPYANRLVLQPPGEDVAAHEPAVPLALLGAIGVATTSLRPAGTAQFGDDFHDVIAEGDFVNPGLRVQVIEIEGTRIVVKEI